MPTILASRGVSFSSRLTGKPRKVAFLCATYLKPEMRHVHRQIVASAVFDPIVITQKIENRAAFPFEPVHRVERTRFRFFGRAVERYVTGRPWQVSGREADAVLDILRESRVEVLHVFFGNVSVHWLSLLRRLPIPFVVSFHGADVAGAIASAGYRAARTEVFERAAWVPCRSRALADRVVDLGCPEEKMRVVRTAVPATEFTERWVPADGTVRLVQASRLIAKKGVATTLRAFARLAAAWPRAELMIAGEGPMEAELRELASVLGVTGRVRFAGFLGEEELAKELGEAHVFLHPSEGADGDVEGVPNAMLEAMAGGLPVVATRHGGIGEVLEDGRNGMLCDERDEAGVARATDRLLKDTELYSAVSRAGADTVRRDFSAEELERSVREIYGRAT